MLADKGRERRLIGSKRILMLSACITSGGYTVAKPNDSRALARPRLFKKRRVYLAVIFGDIAAPRIGVGVAYRDLSVVEVFFVRKGEISLALNGEILANSLVYNAYRKLLFLTVLHISRRGIEVVFLGRRHGHTRGCGGIYLAVPDLVVNALLVFQLARHIVNALYLVGGKDERRTVALANQHRALKQYPVALPKRL